MPVTTPRQGRCDVAIRDFDKSLRVGLDRPGETVLGRESVMVKVSEKFSAQSISAMVPTLRIFLAFFNFSLFLSLHINRLSLGNILMRNAIH